MTEYTWRMSCKYFILISRMRILLLMMKGVRASCVEIMLKWILLSLEVFITTPVVKIRPRVTPRESSVFHPLPI